jgi:hypothetical protein
MSASLRMNLFAVRWSDSAQWRRVRVRNVPQLSAGVDSAALSAWVASLDAAALLWHVTHDSRCVAAASSSSSPSSPSHSGADPLLVGASCAQHHCALWLFARDDVALSEFSTTAEESGVVTSLLARTAAMPAALVDEGVAALHRALHRALVAVLLRSERYQLQMQCLVEVVSSAARLDAPLSLVDLPRRATRLGYRFSLVAAGAISYLVVSLHDVASLESGALLPHADLPPDVYADHELRVMAALVSEQSAFPAAFRWQLGVNVSTSKPSSGSKGAAVLLQPLAALAPGSAAIVDVLSPLYDRRALRQTDTGAQASAEFCSSLARYVDPLLSVREAATALASKRARDTPTGGDASKKPTTNAEQGGDKKRARASSLDGPTAAAQSAPAKTSPQPVHKAQSMFSSPRSTTSTMYIPDSTPGTFSGSFSIIARRQDDGADDDSSSSSSSDSSSSSTSSSSSSANNIDLVDSAANATMLTDAVVNDALETALAEATTQVDPLVHAVAAPPLDAGETAIIQDDPDDKPLRPPKLHRNPEPQPLPLRPPPPPPPQSTIPNTQPPLSSTPRGIGGSPEQPTPPSLFAPSPTARVSPLPLLQSVESDSGAVWRQSEQLVLSCLVPRRFGAGYERAAGMVVARVLRAVAAERVRLECCLELGNAVVERLLVAPAPPTVSCVATATSPSLLAAVRSLARLYEPLATGLHTIDVCSLGESLSAVWRGDERIGTSAVEALRTPELRVGFRGQLIDVAPDALSLWERFQLEPFSQRKDVYFYVVGPDSAHLRDQIGAFMRELTVCYQSCNLGVHEPATSVGVESFVPVDVTACTSRAGYVRAVRDACDELAKALAKRGASRVNSCTVVYVIDPFASDAGELHSEPSSPGALPVEGLMLADSNDDSSIRALADALTPLLLEDERQPAHNLLTTVLPLSDVLHAPLLLATVRDIAFGVYQAGRCIQLSVHAPAPPPPARDSRGGDLRRSAHLFRQQTSFDPPIVHTPIDWRRRRLWEPLFVLAPPALLEAALDATFLHCCYSLERNHLFASVSDTTGELLETIVLPRPIEALPHDADADDHFVRASLSSLWNALLGLIAVAGIGAPSLMLYSFGEMPSQHVRLWEQLVRADADTPYGAVMIASLSTERQAMVYAQRTVDPAVTAPPAAIFFPQAEPAALPSLAFVAHVRSDIDDGAERSAGWPHVHRVTLLHRWYRNEIALESLRASLSKLCHQLARLSWLSTTTRCGGRQTALPWHVAVLRRLTLMF